MNLSALIDLLQSLPEVRALMRCANRFKVAVGLCGGVLRNILSRYRLCDKLSVASQKDGPNSQSMECSDRLFCLWSQRVRDPGGAQIYSIAGDQYF